VQLSAAFAERLAKIVLAGVHRPYPYYALHLMRDDADALTPRQLTPAFCGCFDWHSSVHSHWTLAVLARRFADADWAADARAALASNITAGNIAAEVAYAEARPRFEMPYGLAWLMILATAVDDELAAILRPLASLRRDHLRHWLERLPCAIRTGEHNQSAFAMGLILDAARAGGDAALAAMICARAQAFHGGDRNAPLAYEPSAFDFLSPALAEANLMRRVLPADQFIPWFDAFLPNGYPLTPVGVVDRSDGKLVHADGLNLSRAWMLRAIATALPAEHPHRRQLTTAADHHNATGLASLHSDHYAGQHWLPTFALRAMLRPQT